MKNSLLIQFYTISKPNISKDDIEKTAVFWSKQMGNSSPKTINNIPEIAYEEDFKNLESHSRIIKMSKTEHIDNFFRTGTLMLGSFNYYKSFDNSEIGDNKEGSVIVVGESKVGTIFAGIAGGFNNYLFCCYDGNPDPEIIKNFGYDDYFEIVDPEGFSSSINESLNAVKRSRSKCLYRQHKALVGKTPNTYDYGKISGELENLVSQSKYFIKTSNFNHQNEYRFMWTIEEDIEDYILIDCPEAIKYCKR